MWGEPDVAKYPPRCQKTRMGNGDEIDWQNWELVRDNQLTLLEEQLRREIGATHLLYEAVDRLKVIARDGASDDILAVDSTEHLDAYVVHLVWSDRPSEDANFPSTCSISKSLLPPKYR